MFFNFNKKDALQNFLLGKTKNNNNVFIYDIWNYSDLDLEYKHNYIQWLFPLEEKSKYNLTAPTIKNKNIYNNRLIKENMLKSFQRMLLFYGFKNENNKIVKNSNFKERADNWLRPNNHNFLRITRILKSLTLFNLETQAIAFLDVLLDVQEEYSEIISERTINFWIKAVYGGNKNEYNSQ